MKISIFLSIVVFWSSYLTGQPTGKEVMTKFTQNLSQNYPFTPLVHSTLLKESELLEDGSLLYSNSAKVEYIRNGYLDLDDEDGMKLINSVNEVFTDTLYEERLTGSFGLIRKDIIKYPREFLQPSNNLYDYAISGKFVGKLTVIQVQFLPANSKCIYQGYLYIDAKDFALIRAEYSFTDYGIELLNKTQKAASFEWKELYETVSYSKPPVVRPYLDDDDRYHLQGITSVGKSYNFEWRKEVESEIEIIVIGTNKTTFFANEYFEIPYNLMSVKAFSPITLQFLTAQKAD